MEIIKESLKLKRKSDSYLWHLGDCFDLLNSIEDKSIQLVVTSPPYNIGKEYESKASLTNYLIQTEKLVRIFKRILKSEGSVCFQTGNSIEGREIIPIDSLIYRTFIKEGFKLRNRIIWTYEHGMHARHKYSGRYEVISWFTIGENYKFNLDPVRVPQKQPTKKFYKGPRKGEISSNPLGKNPGDVWPITNIKNGHPEKIDGGHPCQFPLELVERLVLSLSTAGDIVLDPFGGVATTLVAALKHGRRAVSAEISADYHKLGAKRIAQLKAGKLPYKGRFELNKLSFKD